MALNVTTRWLRNCLPVLAGGLLLAMQPAVPAADPAAQKTDRELIQGNWSIKNFILPGGMKIPDEFKDLLKDVRGELKNDKITFSILGMNVEGTYKIDASRDPKWIDITMDGMKIEGIYFLKDNVLRICIGGDPASGTTGARPKAFNEEGAAIIEMTRIAEEPLEPVAFVPEK